MSAADIDPQAQTRLGPSADAGPVSDDADTHVAGPVPTMSGRWRKGQLMGRFVVLDRLGAGAMGEVLSGYDPDLHRKVAIKLLKLTSGDGSPSVDAVERMLREARAMARLSHPNVITVFEVSELTADQLYIAMEFVDGGTLRQWAQREPPHPWPEALGVYRQAGRGLAAAHVAGMVHRDFKPDNVLIGKDGRVRVTDFGLVGVDPRIAEAPTKGDHLTGSLSDVTLTQTGSLLGTPAYMAPEQLQGNADPRADQFSFCVALYEALYGERPFAGETFAELRANLLAGRVRDAPSDTRVPGWVRKAVLRGLSVKPSERWPDVRGLVDALGRDPARSRRRFGMIAAATAAVVTAIAVPIVDQEQPCQGGDEKIDGVWNEARAQTMRDQFVEVAPDHGPRLFARLDTALDGFHDDWLAAYRDACEATHVSGEQSTALLDRRMSCLEDKRQRVSALVEVFERADEAAVDRAARAADRMPTVDRCADVEALVAKSPPPEDAAVRDEVGRIARRLDEAAALGVAGNQAEELSIYERVAASTAATAHPPLQARLALARANALARQTKWPQAAEVLRPATEVAARTGDPQLEARIWILLARSVGYGLNETERGETLARSARAAVIRAGEPPPLVLALESLTGLLYDAAGKYDDAIPHAQRAMALAQELHGPGSTDVAVAAGNLGNLHHYLGKYEDALAMHERALEIDRTTFGDDHPNIADSLINIALVLDDYGKYDEAKQRYERALAIRRKRLGNDHPAIGNALLNLSTNYWRRTKFAEARELLLEALDIWQRVLPDDHPDIALVENNLASIAMQTGDLDEAKTRYERALAVREKAFGATHPKCMHTRNGLAQVLARRGEFDAAVTQLRKALEVGEASLPADHADLAYVLGNLGSALTETGEVTEAIPYLERAVELRRGLDPNLLGRSEFALARAVWVVDKKRARELVDTARARVDELGRSEIDGWLEHVGAR